MKSINHLINPVLEYAWGSYTAIPELLGKKSLSERPQAELWMGAHPKSPSMIDFNDKQISLEKLIGDSSNAILGKRVMEKFGPGLPFLFKLLAVKKPLSIQAHPDARQAKEGFNRENSIGIPLNGPKRNYRDINAKPECLYALTPFTGLVGFRAFPEIVEIMEKIAGDEIKETFGELKNKSYYERTKHFFTFITTLNSDAKQKLINDAVKGSRIQLKKKQSHRDVYEWILRLNREYPEDSGVLAPAFLNFIYLEPGQAVFLGPGILHAYLEGVALELMTNSDNVIRGGLTPKHIDVPELLRIVDFSAKTIPFIEPDKKNEFEQIYSVPADEFALSVIDITKNKRYISDQEKGARILFCTTGVVDIMDIENSKRLIIKKGESVIVPDSVKSYSIEGEARLYKAFTPF